MDFVDSVVSKLVAGNGADGCVSVKREKYRPLAGVDGGDGGNGGSIIIKADSGLSSLNSIKIARVVVAKNGRIGQGSHRNGASGDDVVLKVPVGTIIKNTENNDFIYEFTNDGQEYIICKGGLGGKGNFWISKKTKMKGPDFALKGIPGEVKTVLFEYRVLSDVSLIGFPNAGKSSFISSVSNSKSKVANYPFTTLKPELGTVNIGKDESITISDIPGIIKGASKGKGLGLHFLKHISNAKVLLYMIDPFDTTRDTLDTFKVLENEISSYDSKMLKKPVVIAITKADADKEFVQSVSEKIQKKLKKYKVFSISSVKHFGINDLLYYLSKLVNDEKLNEKKKTPVISLDTIDQNDEYFNIEKTKTKSGTPVFNITGKKPVLWVKQTNFENKNAIDFFNSRLENGKIFESLKKKGISEEALVRVLENREILTEFNWKD